MALTKITGQVINTTTDVTVGILTVTDTLAVGGTVSVGGTLTYEDVTNVDSVGLITARNGIVVGSGITLSKDGDIFATGVTTTGSLVSSGDVTANGGDMTISGANAILHLVDTNDNPNYRVQNIGGTFQIYDATTDTARLSIASGGAATFSGDVNIADKIVHTGDTNTAIRFSGSDKVSVETAGTERLAIEPAGNVNISKSVNVGSGLTVGGLGAGTSLSAFVGQGFIELTRSSGDTYIDFKNAFADDFDSRILTNAANQLQFFTGGQGNTICALQTSTGKVGIATADSPSIAKLQIHSDKLGATAGNTQELLYMLSPDISNATSYRFTNYRHTNGTSHTSSEIRFRRHVDVTDQGYFGLGDNYASIGYGNNEIMRVRSNGLMTNGYQYYLLVDRSSDQTGYDANGSFGTPIVFNRIVTEQKDSSLSSAFNTSNGLFTAPVDGIYQLIAAAYNASGVSFTQSWFTYNGSRMLYSDWVKHSSTLTQNSQIVYLSAGNTVGFHPHAGGGNSSITIQSNANHTYMKVTLLH